MKTNGCARVVAICNQKGGCGKTTSTINIAAGLATLGLRVLVVDLDSQCNATTGLGIPEENIDKSIFNLMVEPKNTQIEDIVLETKYKNLHIAPASLELAEFESRVAHEIGRENRLKKGLAPIVSLYDYILIDTPPSLGLLSINALNFATEVFITLQAHPFALDGLNLLINTVSMIRDEINPNLNMSGIIVTMFDNRTKISREIYDKVIKNPDISEKVFKTCIRQNIKIAEASKFRKSIMDYDKQSTGSEDYMKLCHEIQNQNSLNKNNKKVCSNEIEISL